MKYALRNQEIAMCSPEYVTEHIFKSLNSYFGKQDNKRIMDDISQEKYVSPYGGYYSLLRINDLADDNDGVCCYRSATRCIRTVLFRTHERIKQ